MNKILGSLLLLGLTTAPAMAKDILDKLTVAPGFEVSLFADDVACVEKGGFLGFGVLTEKNKFPAALL